MRIGYYDHREFDKWLRSIGGPAAARVSGKLERAASLGGAGAGMPIVRSLGGSLFEVRVSSYRVYFMQDGATLFVLAGGLKGSQAADIARARRRMR